MKSATGRRPYEVRMTDTSFDTATWIDELIRLLENQEAVVRELAGMAPEQASCIEAGDVDRLLVILGRRQQLVERLLPAQATLGTMTRNLEARLAEVDDVRRERVRSLMDSVDQCMQVVLQGDESDRTRLAEQRDAARTGIEELDAGRRARHGYQASRPIESTNRYADARG